MLESLAEVLQASETAAMEIQREQGVDTGAVRFQLMHAREAGASFGIPGRS